MSIKDSAFNPDMWRQRASGYASLDWVNAPGPLEPLLTIIGSMSSGIVVDFGTGSQAVLNYLSSHYPQTTLIGFDISCEMLGQGEKKCSMLFQSDIGRVALASCLADLVTMRMVVHHIPIEQIGIAFMEIWRVLRPGGKAIIVEYTAVDEEVSKFERVVFDIKEKGRHLWTGGQLTEVVKRFWPDPSTIKFEGYGVLPKYSVKDWMVKSGLGSDIQAAVLRCYLEAPQQIVDRMGIIYQDGDALVNRPFAYVSATKQLV